ncbi:hypothetical protein ACSFA7_21935 [Variovorax sp. LT1R20]
MDGLIGYAAGMLLAFTAVLTGCAPAVRSVPIQLWTIEAARTPPELCFTAPLSISF